MISGNHISPGLVTRKHIVVKGIGIHERSGQDDDASHYQ